MRKPIDENSRVINEAPQDTLALAVTYNATISSSTTITLNVLTTIIEVTAIGAGIYMKWGATATSTVFDEFIGANQTRTYVKPALQTSVQFLQESATAKLIVIEK